MQSRGGTGAPVRLEAPTPRRTRARRPRTQYAAALGGNGLRAGVVAVLGAAALAAPAAAQDAVPVPSEPPRAGQSIVVFPERNMVEAGGYRDGQSVTVDVLRGGVTIGTATGVAEGDDPATTALEGAVEVNHPGGACWTGTGPDIEAGDRVVATAGGAADATTVAHVSAGDYARYARDENDEPILDDDGNYIIRLSGVAKKPDGAYDPATLEARLVNPERFGTGRRTLRAATAEGDGTFDYDATTGEWTAEWHLSEADAAKAVDAEPRIMWLGTDPASESELTIFEFGAGDEGCGAGGIAPVPDAIANWVPAAPAGVSEPPRDGRVIEVFPSRDFVALAGFAAGETAKVEVLRSTQDETTGAVETKLIGLARDLRPNADGEIEINHPGGACWETSDTMPFPDLRPRDQVRVTAYDPAGDVVDVSQTTIADVLIRADTEVTPAGNIRVVGEVRLPDGSPWPAARADELEVRLRSKAFVPLTGGRQDLRANVDNAPTDTLTVNDDGTFVAVFRDKSEAIKRVALDPATEQRIMWLGADPAAGAEATLFERGSEVAGVPECDPPPAEGAPVRDTPIVTPPAGAPAGPQPTDPVLVPGLGGVLTTINGPDGTPVLRGQVDARSLAKLAETGVVSVVLEQKARPDGTLYRFKIRKAGGGRGRIARAAAVSAAAAPKGAVVATFWRTAPKRAGTFRFRLKSRALRGLAPGRYVVEVTPSSARRTAVGKTMRIAFRVR